MMSLHYENSKTKWEKVYVIVTISFSQNVSKNVHPEEEYTISKKGFVLVTMFLGVAFSTSFTKMYLYDRKELTHLPCNLKF